MTSNVEQKKPLKISIVTPSFNQSVFLPFTIKSVLDQQYPKLEYIIIDGDSTDESADIIRIYEHALTYWVSEPDRGQSDAINKGWKRVTGDIIGYLNSDDLLLSGSLEQVSAFFERNKDVDFIYGNAIYIDENGNQIGRLNGSPFDLRQLLLRKQTIPQPTMFFRRRLLDDIGFLNEEFHYTMDFDFWLRTAMKHTLAYIPFDLAAMRKHQEAKTMSKQNLFYLDELNVLSQFFSQPDLPEKIKKSERLVVARCYLRGAEALLKMGLCEEARQIAQKGLRRAPWALLDIRILILCVSLVTGHNFFRSR